MTIKKIRKIRSNKGQPRGPYRKRKKTQYMKSKLKKRKIRSNKGRPRGPYKKSQKLSTLNLITSILPTLKNNNKINNKNSINNKNLIKQSQNEKQCYILTPHGNKILLPREYPGDDWVHANLVENNDKHINLFSDEELKDKFMHYWNICYKVQN
jgi:hypothetical protein